MLLVNWLQANLLMIIMVLAIVLIPVIVYFTAFRNSSGKDTTEG